MLGDDGDDGDTADCRRLLHRWLEESGGGGDDEGGGGEDDGWSGSGGSTAGFLPSDAQKYHGIAGMVIGFLATLRTNLSYDRFYEGRKQM